VLGSCRLRSGTSAGRLVGGLLSALALFVPATARADAECPGKESDIVTDRGDATNSSVVVPAGSLQGEHGAELTALGGARRVAAPTIRLRYGVWSCAEILLDLPSYVLRLRGQASSGFANLAPGVKWQFGPLPGDIDLALIAGVGLPTGAAGVAGRGAQPYLQLPWSLELGRGWGASGMVTTFFFPSESRNKVVTEPTLALEKEIGGTASVFVEYVGDYRPHASPSHLFNTGGAYRFSPTQQIDIHAGFGLNNAAPSFVFGVGYSVRLDALF
jgi:hypothetical protein